MIISKQKYEILDSTNKKARELAFNSAPEGTLIIAKEQTEGRGRLGRSWDSTKGEDIIMSMILRPDIPAENFSMLTIIAALAVNKAIRKESGLNSKIKWPNDIVFEGKKLCGILTEASFSGRNGFAVVGIGINVNSTAFAEAISMKAGSLRQLTGRVFDTEIIIDSVWKEFDEYYEILKTDGDLRNLVEEYNSLTVNYHTPVARTDYNDEEPVSGTAMGIDEKGHLIVNSDDGRKLFLYSGEIQ